MSSRYWYLLQAAQVIDGRVAALKAEPPADAADRAAILEAEHCARLIRALAALPKPDDEGSA